MKKILTIISVGIFVLVLAGCGNKDANPQLPMSSQNETDNVAPIVEKMPEATGDVDATVDAIISGAASEGEQATSTDADATAAMEDGEDTNNLNNIYDENAL